MGRQSVRKEIILLNAYINESSCSILETLLWRFLWARFFSRPKEDIEGKDAHTPHDIRARKPNLRTEQWQSEKIVRRIIQFIQLGPSDDDEGNWRRARSRLYSGATQTSKKVKKENKNFSVGSQMQSSKSFGQLAPLALPRQLFVCIELHLHVRL